MRSILYLCLPAVEQSLLAGVARAHFDSLVVLSHPRKEHRHVPRPFESQYVRVLRRSDRNRLVKAEAPEANRRGDTYVYDHRHVLAQLVGVCFAAVVEHEERRPEDVRAQLSDEAVGLAGQVGRIAADDVVGRFAFLPLAPRQQEYLLAILALQVQIVQREQAPVHALAVARYPALVEASLGRRLQHPLLHLTAHVPLQLVRCLRIHLAVRGRRHWRRRVPALGVRARLHEVTDRQVVRGRHAFRHRNYLDRGALLVFHVVRKGVDCVCAAK